MPRIYIQNNAAFKKQRKFKDVASMFAKKIPFVLSIRKIDNNVGRKGKWREKFLQITNV